MTIKTNVKANFSDVLGDLIQEKKEKEKKKKGIELTNQQIADAIGIGRSQLSRILSGETELGISSLVKIARYFDVSTDYLLGLAPLRSTKEEYKTINKVCGFLDENIDYVKYLNNNNPELSYILNCILKKNTYFTIFLSNIKNYTVKLMNTQTMGSLEYKYIPIGEQDIIGEENNYFFDKPEEIGYLELYKISEISKNIAKNLVTKQIASMNSVPDNKKKKFCVCFYN